MTTPTQLKDYGGDGGVYRLEDGRVIEIVAVDAMQYPAGNDWVMISAKKGRSAWYRWLPSSADGGRG